SRLLTKIFVLNQFVFLLIYNILILKNGITFHFINETYYCINVAVQNQIKVRYLKCSKKVTNHNHNKAELHTGS
ncbi:MAG: hypothetical protein AAFO07_23420, partial [Bacteroidota bacterium]